jgi:predicted ester cyclase
MASENEAVVRRNIDEAWNGGRFEVLDETVAEQYVRHESALPSPVHGRAELKETIRRYRDAFPDLNLVIEDMVSSGDLVTTRWLASGTHRGDLMGLEATNKRSVVTGLNLTRFLDAGLRLEEVNQPAQRVVREAVRSFIGHPSPAGRARSGASQCRGGCALLTPPPPDPDEARRAEISARASCRHRESTSRLRDPTGLDAWLRR